MTIYVVVPGAAEWIAARGDREAVAPIVAQLKKEKSELAKAAMLTTLDKLGEDIGGYVGPDALLKDAEKGLKKARFDKLDWLGLTRLPACSYRSGDAVPPEVLRWWIFLAAKLKQPGGNAMFDLYLERLAPDDAETFSTWILESWCNYDTERPSEEEGNAFAAQHAQQRYTQNKRWIQDYTVERAHEELKREYRANYRNSGAATKGVLFGLIAGTAATASAAFFTDINFYLYACIGCLTCFAAGYTVSLVLAEPEHGLAGLTVYDMPMGDGQQQARESDVL